VKDPSPASGLSVRRGAPTDAALLTQLAARTFRDSFGDENAPEDMELHLSTHYTVAKQAAELSNPAMACFFAEASGVAVGYAQLRQGATPPCIPGEGSIEVLRFYVAGEWHGKGVSRPLMEAAIAEARARGRKRLWLGVWEENPRAIAFYKKCGFVDVGSQDFQLGTDLQHDRVMSLEL
jgi:ribosomal protein S18 acetylase RimI-like enzyme